MAKRLKLPFKSQMFDGSDPIPIFSSLHGFQTARDINGANEGATIWILHCCMKNRAVAALSARTGLTSSLRSRQERELISYFQTVKYLFNTNATEEIIAEADTNNINLQGAAGPQRRGIIAVALDKSPLLQPCIWRVLTNWDLYWWLTVVNQIDYKTLLGGGQKTIPPGTCTTINVTDEPPIGKFVIGKVGNVKAWTKPWLLWERPTSCRIRLKLRADPCSMVRLRPGL